MLISQNIYEGLNRMKKWEKPKITQLGIIKTEGGSSSHSESYVKPNGAPEPGRSFGGASS